MGLLKERLTLLAEKKKKHNLLDSKPSAVLRMAVVGAGSELNGDDAAGLWVVRELGRTLKDLPHVLCVEGGVAPENALGPLRKFQPECVLLVDAADFGFDPGGIRLIENAEVGGFSFSSHTFPLGMICNYMSQELNCPVWLLGIQPASLEFGEPLTPALQHSVAEIVLGLSKLFAE